VRVLRHDDGQRAGRRCQLGQHPGGARKPQPAGGRPLDARVRRPSCGKQIPFERRGLVCEVIQQRRRIGRFFVLRLRRWQERDRACRRGVYRELDEVAEHERRQEGVRVRDVRMLGENEALRRLHAIDEAEHALLRGVELKRSPYFLRVGEEAWVPRLRQLENPFDAVLLKAPRGSQHERPDGVGEVANLEPLGHVGEDPPWVLQHEAVDGLVANLSSQSLVDLCRSQEPESDDRLAEPHHGCVGQSLRHVLEGSRVLLRRQLAFAHQDAAERVAQRAFVREHDAPAGDVHTSVRPRGGRDVEDAAPPVRFGGQHRDREVGRAHPRRRGGSVKPGAMGGWSRAQWGPGPLPPPMQ
jgi:hypothetical protein